MKLNTLPIWVAASIIVLLSISITYKPLTEKLLFSPEKAITATTSINLKFSDIPKKYLTFTDTWYRPSSFYLIPKIKNLLIEPSDILSTRYFNLSLLFVLSIVLMIFYKNIYPDDIFGMILFGTIFSIHPVVFEPALMLYTGDYAFQILIVSASILFISYLKDSKSSISLLILSTLSYIVALTIKEQALIFPGFVIYTAILVNLKFTSSIYHLSKRSISIYITLMMAIALIYLYLRIPGLKQFSNTGEYRVGPNINAIKTNILSGLSWISHLFFFDSTSWTIYRNFNQLENNLYGIYMLSIVVATTLLSFKKGNKEEILCTLLLIGFYATFIVIPVYAGGRPWHYSLSAAAFLMIFARGSSKLITDIKLDYAKWLVTVLVFVIPVTLSTINIKKAINLPFYKWIYNINTTALVNPPVPLDKMPKYSLILYKGGGWSFGSGYLFRFIYQDPTIVELGIDKMDNIPDDIKKKWLDSKNGFYFEPKFDRSPVWKDETEKFNMFMQGKEVPSH